MKIVTSLVVLFALLAASVASAQPVSMNKTGQLVSTATTADQVVVTHTVTASKLLMLSYVTIEGRLTAVSGTASILGDCSLEPPLGTKAITHTFTNPTTSEVDRVPYVFPDPIPLAAGSVVRVVCTPAAVTSMTWKASFGGYEK
jgi:hypothetical protein